MSSVRTAPPSSMRNYTYTTKSGVKIGFFGMETPEAQTKANPALIKGLTFCHAGRSTRRAAEIAA